MAEAAGIQIGDRIVSVDDKDVSNWRQFYLRRPRARNVRCGWGSSATASASSGRSCPSRSTSYETGAIGVMPVTHPQIDALQKGQPGEEGGLQKGDFILPPVRPKPARRAGGTGELSGDVRQHLAVARPIARERLIERFRRTTGRPLALDVLRGGAPHTITVMPRVSTGRCASARQITSLELKIVEPGPVEAFKLSVEAELGMDDDDLRDPGWSLHAPDLGEAADGAGGDRRPFW